MVAGMLGVAAKHEWERMVERQLGAKQRSRAAGLRSSGTSPFGYRYDERDARGQQIPGVSKGLRPEPREAQAVADAYRSLLAGESLHSIQRTWNAAGFTTGRGGAWTTLHVRRCLLRAANAALIEYPAQPYGRGEIVGRAQWPPIVDEETWLAARAILMDPARRCSPGAKPQHLLTGVLICGVCGCRQFGVKRQGSSKTPVYTCASAYREPGNPRAGYHLGRTAAPLEKYITDVLIGLLRRPETLAVFTPPAADIEGLRSEHTGLRARLDELGTLLGEGHIDGLQVAAASKPLQQRLADVEKKLEDAYTAPGLDEFAGGRDPEQVWNGLPMDRKRAVLKTLLRVRLLKAGQGPRYPRAEDHAPAAPLR